MKTKILITLFAILMTIGTTFAESGGTRGGEVIKVDGKWVLRDRMDDTTYICYMGTDMVQRTGNEWNKMMENLSLVNWYAARIYKKELERVYFCVGGADLVVIDTEDKDSLTQYYSDKVETKLVAIRKGNAVRVDGSKFDSLSNLDKAGLLFHELTHSFISGNAVERNNKVRSFTKVVLLNNENLFSEGSFAFQMQVNQIQISSNYQVLKQNKENAKKVLNSDASLLEKVEAARLSKEIYRELSNEDKEIYLEYLNVNKFLKIAIESNSLEDATLLISLGGSSDDVNGLELSYDKNFLDMFKLLLDYSKVQDALVDQILKDNERSFLGALLNSKNFKFTKDTKLLERASKLSNKEFLSDLSKDPKIDSIYTLSENMNIVLPILASNRSDMEEVFIAHTNIKENPAFNVIEIYAYAIERNFTKVMNYAFSYAEEDFVNIENARGDTALDIAIVNNDKPLFDKVVNSKFANLKRVKYGNSYLHKTVLYNRLEMAQVLIEEKGMNPKSLNDAGLTPFKLAKKYHKKAMKDYLKQYK